jgi:catechol 2,3-dioxygenase-like lactoylglutathione lyase family enzyme
MILDHIGLTVSDAQASKAFFSAALAPLGVSVVMEAQGWVGMGKDGKPDFWFGAGGTPHAGMHLAFAAGNRAQVARFTGRAGRWRHGQRPAGIRAIYHPNYYGAFVLGPDGHNVEAVCHRAED